MVTILDYTDKFPLQHIGIAAGVCWNSNVNDSEANFKRAIDCIESGHGRVEEYPDVEMVIEGYSARCIRELYTHIVGTTRLQESTRYVDCNDFQYYEPNMSLEAKVIYDGIMNDIKDAYTALLANGVSKEDAANVLPLGMHTKIVWKVNLRALIHFMEMRLCSRAYKEIRVLCNDIISALSDYSVEWNHICFNYFKPKCLWSGKCTEKKSCGRVGNV